MDEINVLQGVLNGLTCAGWYVLVAVGLSLVLSIMNIVQLSHGEIYMIGAYVVYYFCVNLGISFYLGFVIAVLASGLLGIVLERVFFRPFRGKPDQALVLSIGLILVFQNIVLAIAGGTPKSYRSPFEGVVKIGSLALSTERLVIIIAGFVLIGALFLFIRFAKNGQAMLAISQDREGAALQGININRLSAIAMFVGCALAGVAGGLVGALFTLTPTMGATVLMKGIAVIILGGLGSISGAVLGGLIIGLIDGLVPVVTSSYMASLIGFAIVILILLFRPRGLWGHE
ncbi:MAG: branched-chain amino acid ABC transporter permease [Actinobacteria bacterium]|nr:branched-chain amino acid ABC transporter permease [Actinomycetota bacterium]